MIIGHAFYYFERVLVCYPSSIYGVHVYSFFSKGKRTGSGNHIEGCFCHIGMRVARTFVKPIENSLHGGNINNPGRSGADHFLLQFADEMEGNNWVDNLSCITVQQWYILNRLAPWVGWAFVGGLSEFVQLLSVNVSWFDGNLIWKKAGERKWFIIAFDDSRRWITFFIFYH